MLDFTRSPPNSDYKKNDPKLLKDAEPVSEFICKGKLSSQGRFAYYFFGILLLWLLHKLYSGAAEISDKTLLEMSHEDQAILLLPLFVSLGLLWCFNSLWKDVREFYLEESVKKLSDKFPGQPWKWDFFWDPLGFSKNAINKQFNTLIRFYFLASLLVVYFWTVFRPQLPFFIFFVKGIFILITMAVGWKLLMLGICLIKYGKSYLLFRKFPFMLGESLKVELKGLPPVKNIEELELSLRFIEERYEIFGYGEDRGPEIVCYEVYVDSRKRTGQELPYSPALEMEWPLPNDTELTTQLSARPARFWELEVKAKTPGVDYHERFLLPVYAKA